MAEPTTHQRGLDLRSQASDPATAGEAQPFSATLERALVILDQIARGAAPTHSDLTRATGAPKGSVSKLLAELRRLGYVKRVDGNYHAGAEFIVLARNVIERSPIARLRPLLESVAAATGESVFLGVEVGRTVGAAGLMAVIDRVEGENPARWVIPLGRHDSMHAAAAGNVLLAFSNRGAADLPDDPDVDAAALDAEIARVRARGYSIKVYPGGATAVAAPVLGADGVVQAAVSVVGLTDHVGDPVQTIVPHLIGALAAFPV